MASPEAISREWRAANLKEAAGLTVRQPKFFPGAQPYLATADVNAATASPSEEFSFENRPARAGLQLAEGDVLQAKMMATNKALLVSCQQAGWLASTGFALFSPNDVGSVPAYFYHWLQSDDFHRQKDRLCVGSTQKAISQTDLAAISLRVPEPREQALIANVLGLADQVIAKMDAVITKLKQARAGLLHDLLTRGLDAHGQLRPPPEKAPYLYKDSPLGRIPREWTIEPLESCCTHVVDCPHSTPTYLTAGVLVARTMHIRDGRYDVEFSSRVSEEEFVERIARLQPQPGDVIFTREAPVGEAFVIPSGMRICLGQRVMLLRPSNSKLTGGYLVTQIYSGTVRHRIDGLTGGTTNPHLNVAEIRTFTIPLPKVEEQRRIVACFSAHDALMESETAQLNKLRNVKTGLMTDLFTGHVRVPAKIATHQQELKMALTR